MFFSLGMGFALLVMGLDIDLEKVKQVLRRPVGPLVGFCSQFLAMPGISYLRGYLLLEAGSPSSPNPSGAELIRAARPAPSGLLSGGSRLKLLDRDAWRWVLTNPKSLPGDINLSVTMTFFSSVAAFAMTSFWIWALGSPLVSQSLPIPYTQLVIALVSFSLPVGLGVAIRRRWPERAERVRTMWVACHTNHQQLQHAGSDGHSGC
jgi:sodium/bile acid cotransporter 3/5